ncbi:MAG: NYN domain-containing protein [Spirochaetota bacterium]|nr:NYN domain-containing protein [Spirochaetota bacterium]
MSILIDGFNLIYKFPELEELMYNDRLVDARKGLLQKLKEYVKITGSHIRVVFDGKKEMGLDIRSERFGTIDVYYSLDYSADFLIKEFVKKDINPRMVTVVTSDKDIISFVTRYRAKVQTSDKFAEYINTKIEKHLEAQIPEKEENPILSEEELLFWEGLFQKGNSKDLQER